MTDFIRSLAQILLNVAQDSISTSGDGTFSANDVIFANKLLRETILTITVPTLPTLSAAIAALCVRDSDLCLWAEREISHRGAEGFAKHLWITYATMP